MRTSNFKFGLRLLALASLLLPLLTVLYFSETFLRRNVGDEQQSYYARYEELFNPSVNAPILILGSSNSGHGIVPSSLKLGKPVFNFSFNGATPAFNLAFYRDYLKKHYSKPTYIIYALSPNSFTHFWRKIEDDLKYIPAGHRGLLVDALRNPTYLKTYTSSGITQDIAKVFARNFGQGPRLGMDMRKYDNGFLPYSEGKDLIVVENQSLIPEQSEIEALKTLLTEIKRDGTKIIIVTLPTPHNQFRSEDMASFERTVDKLAELVVAPVIKADTVAPGFNTQNRYFNDAVHLTEVGARTYTDALSVALRPLTLP